MKFSASIIVCFCFIANSRAIFSSSSFTGEREENIFLSHTHGYDEKFKRIFAYFHFDEAAFESAQILSKLMKTR